MIFSKLLYGPAIFLVIMVNSAISAADYLQHKPHALIILTLLLVIFTLLGTLGWQWVLRRGNYLHVYFGLQSLIMLAVFLLENIASGGGATVNLATPLLLQIGVLGWRTTLIFVAITTLLLSGVSLFFFPLAAMPRSTINLAISNALVALFSYLIVSQEHARRQLAEAHQKLAVYAAQVEDLATMRERNRLAREIHDNLGHYLTVVNIQIEAARAILPDDVQRGSYLLERAQNLTKEGLAEIRRSVAALRATPIEAHPLPEALHLLAAEHTASGLPVTYHLEGQVRPCSPQIELTLYRLAQEGLTNVRKHAQATHAELHLCYTDAQCVKISVQDDGVGCVNPQRGFGLLGLEERARLLGGTLSVQSVSGLGCHLHMELPT